MTKFKYIKGSTNDLDQIKQLWEKLNQLHSELSEDFKRSFQTKTWELRKKDLISKSKEIHLNYVVDETNSIIGYCISTVDRIDESIGEIDSLYVEQIYRDSGIGKTLMNKAIDWLLSKNTITQRLFVSSGNEQVLSFYEKFGFYPKNIKLERI
ncbi:MAG: GNAT family N-acetyltransferase [Bacteroidales bacterium]|jgi:ribosomal protein S18 acetylase RimI-like enzyme|nr:GNAT family N-acetyltransferase [Bacteroidales bacterium]